MPTFLRLSPTQDGAFHASTPMPNIGILKICIKDTKLGVKVQPDGSTTMPGATQSRTTHIQAKIAWALNKCVNVIVLLLLLLNKYLQKPLFPCRQK
jgi:hypothetical protein